MKKLSIVFLISVLACFSVYPQAHSQSEIGDSECFKMFIQVGEKKFEQGKYTHAAYLFQAAGSCPDTPKANELGNMVTNSKACAKFLLKADAKYDGKKYEAAIQYYDLILQMNKKDMHCVGRKKVCEDRLTASE